MNVETLGWNDSFAAAFTAYTGKQYTVGRVSAEHRTLYEVLTTQGAIPAVVSGKFLHTAQTPAEFPAVGDWVVLTINETEHKAIIHAILPRKSRFSRTAAGNTTDEQIIAANIDTLFIVSSLNREFNVRRIERYITMAWESGATPVIVLSKADLCEDIDGCLQAVEDIAPGIPVHVVSALQDDGLDELGPYFREGSTIVVLGSSGVGKSTLLNALIGDDILKTSDIASYKDRGRHTTTHRQMVVLPGRGILIDTPGLRELRLHDEGDNVSRTFADIETLMQSCRFLDCTHNGEPGCAVDTAIDDGSLDPDRYESFLKLQREAAHHRRKELRSERAQTRKNIKTPYDRKTEKLRRQKW
jgi:ribosome biogenesis GTPase